MATLAPLSPSTPSLTPERLLALLALDCMGWLSLDPPARTRRLGTLIDAGQISGDVDLPNAFAVLDAHCGRTAAETFDVMPPVSPEKINATALLTRLGIDCKAWLDMPRERRLTMLRKIGVASEALEGSELSVTNHCTAVLQALGDEGRPPTPPGDAGSAQLPPATTPTGWTGSEVATGGGLAAALVWLVGRLAGRW
ncbi:MAG TPA: hypothetical protein VHH11_14075 [Gammaproteobacteria bacterium]|nr:hypothetical protein [Gammaproteobacteria bacterium]